MCRGCMKTYCKNIASLRNIRRVIPVGIKVAKFGGSSVADAIQLTKTKEIIEADPERRYVVVSLQERDIAKIIRLQTYYIYVRHISITTLPYEQVFQVICDRLHGHGY